MRYLAPLALLLLLTACSDAPAPLAEGSHLNYSTTTAPDGRMIYSKVAVPAAFSDPTLLVTKMAISLKDQQITFYVNDKVVGDSPVSTGKPGYETPPGCYSVEDKDIDHVSNLFTYTATETFHTANGDVQRQVELPAPMPYFMRLTDYGIGIHGGLLPGYAASHGCIRLPFAVAEALYPHVSIGTPVIIN